MLRAYHGDPAIKQRYLDRLAAHEAADEIVQGVYWQRGRGCAIGCTIHGKNHSAYERELGIPRVLAHLEDRIFELLPLAEAKRFPRRMLEAIPVGADLSLVWPRFCPVAAERSRVGRVAACAPGQPGSRGHRAGG